MVLWVTPLYHRWYLHAVDEDSVIISDDTMLSISSLSSSESFPRYSVKVLQVHGMSFKGQADAHGGKVMLADGLLV